MTGSSPLGSPAGYDRIGISDANGAMRYMNKSEFENLPVAERVRLLMGGKLKFFRGEQQVTAREALKGA
jgi:hypothetical protein